MSSLNPPGVVKKVEKLEAKQAKQLAEVVV